MKKVKVDLRHKVVGGQLSNVVVEFAKSSVIADHVDGQYSYWNRTGHNSHIINVQLVKYLLFLLFLPATIYPPLYFYKLSPLYVMILVSQFLKNLFNYFKWRQKKYRSDTVHTYA